jgi:hypothetical protein
MNSSNGRRPKFSKALFQRVLDRIRNDLQGTVGAIQAEGMSKSGFYQALAREDRDGQMRKALDKAQLWRDQIINQAALEEAEEELFKRGVKGWQEPVYYQGEVVGTRPRHSDVCLFALLRKLAPEKYRESVPVEIHNRINGGSGPLPTQAERKKLEEDLAEMVRGLHRRIKGRDPEADQ